MNNLRTFPPKFLQKPSPYFFMVHLLHRLYGVDAPAWGPHPSPPAMPPISKHHWDQGNPP